MLTIHTPEFDYEKDRVRVEKAAKRYELNYPIYMDNSYAYWNALGNRFWPSFYLVDKSGRIRGRTSGTIYQDTRTAKVMEDAITELLAE